MSTTDTPGVDRTRPVSNLSDRELDAMLAEWMGWTFWEAPNSKPVSRWCYKPGIEVEASGSMRQIPASALTVKQVPRAIPLLSSTHDGAAALRQHVEDQGVHFVISFAASLAQVVGPRGMDPHHTISGVILALRATPRQQAEAAYEAFIRTAPGSGSTS